jgi:hypothetical protein
MTEAECARALRGEVAHWREFIADMAAGLRQGAQAHPEMPILGAGFVKIADQLDEHLRAALSASPPPSPASPAAPAPSGDISYVTSSPVALKANFEAVLAERDAARAECARLRDDLMAAIGERDEAEKASNTNYNSGFRDGAAAVAAEARRYAAMYPQASDGRNTFIMLAKWAEQRTPPSGLPLKGGEDHG